jgi:hypothetical protein
MSYLGKCLLVINALDYYTAVLIYTAKSFNALAIEEIRGRIHNTSFSKELTNGPNNLGCYIH